MHTTPMYFLKLRNKCMKTVQIRVREQAAPKRSTQINIVVEGLLISVQTQITEQLTGYQGQAEKKIQKKKHRNKMDR